MILKSFEVILQLVKSLKSSEALKFWGEILEADLKQVNWWEASLIIVRVGATVASWYASGTAQLTKQKRLICKS